MSGIITIGIVFVLALLELKVWFYRRGNDQRDWRSDDGTSRYNGSNWGSSGGDSWLDFFSGGDSGGGFFDSFFDGSDCGGDGGGD